MALDIVLLAAWLGATGMASAAGNAFVGNWSLTLPGGGVGWLGIVETNGMFRGSVLWGTGNIQEVSRVTLDGNNLQGLGDDSDKPPDSLAVSSDVLVLVRESPDTIMRGGKLVAVTEIETIRATREGSSLKLMSERTRDGMSMGRVEFSGRWIPRVPPAPDLARVSFADPIQLFNGRDLQGWKLVNSNRANGWRVVAGVLANCPDQQPDQPGRILSDLQTEREFEDFRLTCETRIPTNGNSGIYLRGVYEVQVADSFGRPPDVLGMGALYGRIAPAVSAAKPAGAWQRLVITLVARHLTVVLNGVTIIDNQPVLGCTGGALWGDGLRPGPIRLQGDHTAVELRNLKLEPVVWEAGS